MASQHFSIRFRPSVIACVAGGLMVPWAAVQADRSIHEHATVDSSGVIEIVNVAGSVELTGWDRSEIDVTGTAGDSVDRVEVVTTGKRASIRVVTRSATVWGGDNEAALVIHVPVASEITATLVSSTIELKNLRGNVSVQSVSGDVHGSVGADLHAGTVSGDVSVLTPAARRIEAKTVSGDIQLSGGGGEVDISTISGTATMSLQSITHGRFKSVSGDLTADFGLATDAQIEGESVSGSLSIDLAEVPAADVDVESFSGTISNCFGPKPSESRYGPGSRLTFGGGPAHIHIDTKSGDVHLCAKDLHGHRSASRRQVAYFPLI